MYSILIQTTLSICLIVIGISTLFSKIEARKYFSAICFATTFWIIFLNIGYRTNTHSPTSLIFIKLTWAIGPIIFLFLAFFTNKFPFTTNPLSPLKKFFLIAVTTFFSISALFTNAIEKQIIPQNSAQEYGFLYFPYIIFLSLLLAYSLKESSKKYYLANGIEKKRIRSIIYGMIFPAALIASINVIFPYLSKISIIVDVPLLLVAMVIILFVAIQKYRFFHLPHFPLSILRKLILTGISAFVIIISHHLLSELFENLSMTVISSLSSMFGTLTFIELNKYLPYFYTQDHRSLLENIKSFEIKLNLVKSFKELSDLLEEYFVINLKLIYAKVYLVKNETLGKNLPEYENENFIKAILQQNKKIYLSQETIGRKNQNQNSETIQNGLLELQASMLMPLFCGRKIIGFLSLGEKSDRENFLIEEVNELMKIQKKLEISLMNVLISENIQHENNLLKKIVYQKTKSLNKLLKKKSDFITITAHEFRTPLSIAFFQIEELLYKYKNNEKIVNDIKTVEKSILILKNLTQELFTAEQYDLEKIPLNKEKVYIKDLIIDIYNEFFPLAREKNISLSCNIYLRPDLCLEIDKTKIRQVLQNLISNSIKFSDSHDAKVQILVMEKNKCVQIKVIDNGCGLKNINENKIFNKFHSKLESGKQGIGLGLYICKKIIELHGGQISARNNDNCGATFAIRLSKNIEFEQSEIYRCNYLANLQRYLAINPGEAFSLTK